MKKLCINCGAEIKTSDKSCPYCKKPIKELEKGANNRLFKELSKIKNKIKEKNSQSAPVKIRRIWDDAISALNKNDIDQFLRKMGAAVEQAVVYKYNEVFGSDPSNIKWGMKNLREMDLISERQSDLNWLWDTRNELTHSAIDLNSSEIQRALKFGNSVIDGCLK